MIHHKRRLIYSAGCARILEIIDSECVRVHQSRNAVDANDRHLGYKRLKLHI